MSESLLSEDPYQPLAARMRPANIEYFYGQEHLLAPGKPLREAIVAGHLHSMILWGPPGVGKTTLARMIARGADARFENISAVLSGVKEIRGAIASAQQERESRHRKTVLFVDEVHRFNKAQQDAFLPFIEDGTIFLVGATTENPSFELNNALLSRCRVYALRPLTGEHIRQVVVRALGDGESGFRGNVLLDDEALELLVSVADGDARRALNILEICADLIDETAATRRITKALLQQVAVADPRRFDKGGDYFYDQISALHKAVRGSSPDAALYWLVRMLDAGCEPLYLARRLVRMASEDIGNADPRALSVALDAWNVQERLGSPEGELTLAQAVIYLAVAPKSNAVYSAYNAARKDIQNMPSLEVPLHLRNAPTKLMQEMDNGKTYRYAHDEPGAFAAGENYFPEALQDKHYYQPTERGLEAKISEKLSRLRQLNRDSSQQRYRTKPGETSCNG